MVIFGFSVLENELEGNWEILREDGVELDR
jgi:hypothetical protein